jgi:hypothetical protein
MLSAESILVPERGCYIETVFGSKRGLLPRETLRWGEAHA